MGAHKKMICWLDRPVSSVRVCVCVCDTTLSDDLLAYLAIIGFASGTTLGPNSVSWDMLDY